MSAEDHKKTHLEGAIKNLLAFEHHAETDACPHCMTKHMMLVEQLLGEESEQRNGVSTQALKVAKELRKSLDSAYDGAYVKEDRMHDLMQAARTVRLSLMKELGMPEHHHLPAEFTKIEKESDRAHHKAEHVLVS